MEKIIYKIDEIHQIAKGLLQNQREKTLCFYGQMGTGKTTLIKTMLQHLGAIDIGHSPTFGLVNEYHDVQGTIVAYHFDFYRIQSLEEALDIGLEDYFTNDITIFIEWPEKIERLLPEEYHKVSLYFIDENTRRIEY